MTVATNLSGSTDTARASVLPHRGTILCLFREGQNHGSIESALGCSGMTVLRARNDLHAMFMARTVKPDVILMDIADAAEEGHPFLDSLRRHPASASIPVVAFVPSLKQSAMGQTCLRHVATTLLQDTSAETVMAEINQILVAHDRTFHRLDSSTASIDAVFSELGSPSIRGIPGQRRPGGPRQNHDMPAELAAGLLSTPERIHKVDEPHDIPAGVKKTGLNPLHESAS